MAALFLRILRCIGMKAENMNIFGHTLQVSLIWTAFIFTRLIFHNLNSVVLRYIVHTPTEAFSCSFSNLL